MRRELGGFAKQIFEFFVFDREDDGGRGVHPLAFRRSRRELVDERRPRPAGIDP